MIDTIQLALEINKPFTIDTHSEIKFLSRFSQIIDVFNRNFHNERLANIARIVAENLKDLPRNPSIPEAVKNPAAQTARQFLKYNIQPGNKDPRIEECRQQLLAYKLGINSSILDLPINTGFKEFASMPPLERYLIEYNHTIQVDAQTNEIQLLSGGIRQGWSEIKDILKPIEENTQPNQPWYYGPEGLQHKNMYDWTTLVPYKIEDPAQWDHQYIFEFCTCVVDSPRKTGDHSWLRLKTPEGEIYCVGIYRPGKTGLSDNIKLPLRIKKGYLMQPDVSEFYPIAIQRIPIAITKEQFEKMKLALEEDKKNDDQTFQLFNSNCTLYAAKIAKLGNILLPTKKTLWRLLTPKPWEPMADWIDAHLPEPLKNVIYKIGVIQMNLLQVVLGGAFVDEKVKEVRPDASAHINQLSDLFDASKAELNHPNTLGHMTRDLVMDWRERELALLSKELIEQPENEEQIREKILTVKWGLPAEFRLTSQ